MANARDVHRFVAEQLALVQHPERRRALAALLVEPREEWREWDYGEPGEGFTYWVVGEAPERGVLLAYCDRGFGPVAPWGILFADMPGQVSPEPHTLGMDAQWNWYLEEAFVRAGLWEEPTAPAEPWTLPPEVRFGAQPRTEA